MVMNLLDERSIVACAGDDGEEVRTVEIYLINKRRRCGGKTWCPRRRNSTI